MKILNILVCGDGIGCELYVQIWFVVIELICGDGIGCDLFYKFCSENFKYFGLW
jgi:hypothetical protein